MLKILMQPEISRLNKNKFQIEYYFQCHHLCIFFQDHFTKCKLLDLRSPWKR